MNRLGETVRGLRAYRSRLDAAANFAARDTGETLLKDIEINKENPGNLRARAFIPNTRNGAAPLVVVLHGCTQNAEAFDYGTGWSALAQADGFAVLFPEQTRENNPNLCFNWFQTADIEREKGEAASIRAMIQQVAEDPRIDSTRIYITGLSAGGAMAAVMLAAYPEVFAGGAIIAGLPYGAASSVKDAFQSMSGGVAHSAQQWGDKVRSASPHEGRWPTISIWHGDADNTVHASNSDHLVAQWLNVHGADSMPPVKTSEPAGTREAWRDSKGRLLVESYRISGMGHGVPLDVRDGETESGHAGPFLLDVGVPSTEMIAANWKLCTAPARRAEKSVGNRAEAMPEWMAQKRPLDRIQTTIQKALAAAGLLK